MRFLERAIFWGGFAGECLRGAEWGPISFFVFGDIFWGSFGFWFDFVYFFFWKVIFK
jgi:hypothetical protein